MPSFARHDLVWLSASGWEHARGQAADDETAACLAHWARERLPLVVGRQPPGEAELALGLAAPVDWGRRKIALRVPREAVLYHDRFPRGRAVARLLAPALRPTWHALLEALAACEVDVRVHGSYGWQQLTGLKHVLGSSDLDLLLPVADAAVADAVAERLEGVRWQGPRIDGELLFPGGAGVAWREWLQFRRGAVDRVLVKRLHGVALEDAAAWAERAAAVAA
jgi:phosphoribosyl-dephospho-CoA transferase